MSKQRRLGRIFCLIGGFILGLAAMAAPSVFAANVNSGTFTMKAATSLSLTCPNALSNSSVTSNGETADCAADPTTTTSAPPITTTTTTVPPTTTTTQPSGCTAGFGQPCMATPAGYTAAQMVMDEKFSGTTLDSHWSNVMGGPEPDVGRWGGYGGTPVVNNGLTLTNANGTASMVNTDNPATGQKLFTFPSTGFYLQVNFKVTDTTHGFWPAIWFPYDNGIHPNAWEMDVYEGGMKGGSCYNVYDNTCVETNYGGSGSTDSLWDQVFAKAGQDLTTGFETIGYEWQPGNHVNVYLGQGANRTLILHDTNAANIGAFSDYNLVITPQNGGSAGSWHTSGSGTGSMYVAEVQVYALP